MTERDTYLPGVSAICAGDVTCFQCCWYLATWQHGGGCLQKVGLFTLLNQVLEILPVSGLSIAEVLHTPSSQPFCTIHQHGGSGFLNILPDATLLDAAAACFTVWFYYLIGAPLVAAVLRTWFFMLER